MNKKEFEDRLSKYYWRGVDPNIKSPKSNPYIGKTSKTPVASKKSMVDTLGQALETQFYTAVAGPEPVGANLAQPPAPHPHPGGGNIAWYYNARRDIVITKFTPEVVVRTFSVSDHKQKLELLEFIKDNLKSNEDFYYQIFHKVFRLDPPAFNSVQEVQVVNSKLKFVFNDPVFEDDQTEQAGEEEATDVHEVAPLLPVEDFDFDDDEDFFNDDEDLDDIEDDDEENE